MSTRIRVLACALLAAGVVGRAAAEVNPFEAGSAPVTVAAPSNSPVQAPAATAEGGAAAKTAAEAEARINRTLDQKLKAPMDFSEIPLAQVAEQLREEYDIPIRFDLPALEAAALSPDVQVTISVNNVSLRAALDLLLRQIEDMTYIIDNEVLLLTTKDVADQRLKVVVYRVDDLVRTDGGGFGADDYDFDSLVDIIVSSVEKDSWEENGSGEGELNSFAPGMLVVSNTARVHDQIARLLADMRRVKGGIEASPAAATAAETGPITRGIPLAAQAVGGSDANREMVRSAIVQSVDWGADKTANTGDHFLYVLPERVFVRHLPHVVRQVERVMADMGTKPKRERGSFGPATTKQEPKTEPAKRGSGF